MGVKRKKRKPQFQLIWKSLPFIHRVWSATRSYQTPIRNHPFLLIIVASDSFNSFSDNPSFKLLHSLFLSLPQTSTHKKPQTETVEINNRNQTRCFFSRILCFRWSTKSSSLRSRCKTAGGVALARWPGEARLSAPPCAAASRAWSSTSPC